MLFSLGKLTFLCCVRARETIFIFCDAWHDKAVHTFGRHIKMCIVHLTSTSQQLYRNCSAHMWYLHQRFIYLLCSSKYAELDSFLFISVTVWRKQPLKLKFVQSLMNLHHSSTTTRQNKITGNPWDTSHHMHKHDLAAIVKTFIPLLMWCTVKWLHSETGYWSYCENKCKEWRVMAVSFAGACVTLWSASGLMHPLALSGSWCATRCPAFHITWDNDPQPKEVFHQEQAQGQAVPEIRKECWSCGTRPWTLSQLLYYVLQYLWQIKHILSILKHINFSFLD